MYDAVGLIAEFLNVYVDYESIYIRELVYLAGVALKKREALAKAAAKGGAP